ncbi:ABC transporter substrate-binding protein [Novipirellula artificiosorum]|uniref:Bacterial extracellular solute-binding protein n=1 Tax=Novipirellula artificiosorum TaxID=2528016 RepID=A0A5C6E1L9_9BACT|nr:extracellular solute-binding protein [Novipirellula artificiosorum]TWU42790.1 Bacterial extracellular solute-binding protein [Novipirellula artificiosorum]
MTLASTPLRGITWDHTRGYLPMVATAQRFGELHQGIDIRWEKRSLQAFADQPLGELAAEYDLLVIDHPWAGFAAEQGVLEPLDPILPQAFLLEQQAQSVGASHESYRFDDQQWALAIDAATPVASWRADLLAKHGVSVPHTWEDLIHLARKGLVLVPGIAQDTLMNFYMLGCRLSEDVSEGGLFHSRHEVIDLERGIEVLERLRELASFLPRESFDWNPIRIYERMTQTDDWAYCPFAYGYSNYAREGYARRRLKFGDVVQYGSRRMQTTLGGTGLAISSRCKHLDAAIDYVQMVAGPRCQCTQFTENGGQPGCRLAWLDDELNRRTDDYFRDTLPCLDRAYLRPRYSGSLRFQGRDGGGAPIRAFLRDGGDPKTVLEQLNTLYRESQQGASA